MENQKRTSKITVFVTPELAGKIDEERVKLRNVSRSTAVYWILEDVLSPSQEQEV